MIFLYEDIGKNVPKFEKGLSVMGLKIVTTLLDALQIHSILGRKNCKFIQEIC